MFPAIATKLPEQLRAASAAVKVEQVDDSMNKLEADNPMGETEPAAEEEEKKDDDAKKDDAKK